MKFWTHFAGTAALGLALLIAAAACGGDSASKTGGSRGVVTAVDASAHTITLDHEEIPGMMEAMTMRFDVAPDVSLAGIEPGAKVEFQLKVDDSGYQITEMHPSR